MLVEARCRQHWTAVARQQVAEMQRAGLCGCEAGDRQNGPPHDCCLDHGARVDANHGGCVIQRFKEVRAATVVRRVIATPRPHSGRAERGKINGFPCIMVVRMWTYDYSKILDLC